MQAPDRETARRLGLTPGASLAAGTNRLSEDTARVAQRFWVAALVSQAIEEVGQRLRGNYVAGQELLSCHDDCNNTTSPTHHHGTLSPNRGTVRA